MKVVVICVLCGVASVSTTSRAREEKTTAVGTKVELWRTTFAPTVRGGTAMAEYIELEAALYRAKSFLANHIDGIVAEHAQLPYETCNATEFARGYERGAIDAVKVVLATPSADVEVVKHGRWVDRYGGKYANPLYECSECIAERLKQPAEEEA